MGLIMGMMIDLCIAMMVTAAMTIRVIIVVTWADSRPSCPVDCPACSGTLACSQCHAHFPQPYAKCMLARLVETALYLPGSHQLGGFVTINRVLLTTFGGARIPTFKHRLTRWATTAARDTLREYHSAICDRVWLAMQGQAAPRGDVSRWLREATLDDWVGKMAAARTVANSVAFAY